jgi:myo-inositol 2-dehydrogenase / D-chiro-inositol 1-dehydrogenase
MTMPIADTDTRTFTNSDPVRIAVLGVGLMGSAHAQRLARTVPGGTVVAVSDVDEARALAVADRVGGCRVLANPFDAFTADDVEGVVIATPATSHEDLLLAAIDAGIPTLCEKPLGVSAESARRVLDAERAAGRRLVQLGFMRRFDHEYAQLRERVARGEIGTPLVVSTTVRTTAVPPSFTSEMIIEDAAVHDFDMARFLTDDEISDVTVHAGAPTARAHAGLQDPLVIVARTQRGALCTLSICMSSGLAYETSTEVLGSAGALHMGLDRGVVKRTLSGTLELRGVPDFIERFSRAYIEELALFVDGIGAGELSGPGTWDGYAAAVVCEAAVEALHTGQRIPVSLDRHAVAG